MQRSFAEHVTGSQLMLSGLAAHQERLARRGISQTFLEDYREALQVVLEDEAAQEALKARLRERTASLYAKIADLDRQYRLARKLVKIELPREGWLEFGIRARR